MRIAATIGMVAIGGALVAACSQGDGRTEEASSTAQAYGEDACKFVNVDPNGQTDDMGTPTNFGKTVSNPLFDACRSQQVIVFDTTASYPGDPSCQNQAIIRLLSPKGQGADFSVWLWDGMPKDQATCTATHITGTVWGRRADNSWVKLNTPAQFGGDTRVKEDYAGVWNTPAKGAAYCSFEMAGYFGQYYDNLDQYQEIRFVAGAFRAQSTGKNQTTNVPLRAQIIASNPCII